MGLHWCTCSSESKYECKRTWMDRYRLAKQNSKADIKQDVPVVGGKHEDAVNPRKEEKKLYARLVDPNITSSDYPHNSSRRSKGSCSLRLRFIFSCHSMTWACTITLERKKESQISCVNIGRDEKKGCPRLGQRIKTFCLLWRMKIDNL